MIVCPECKGDNIHLAIETWFSYCHDCEKHWKEPE